MQNETLLDWDPYSEVQKERKLPLKKGQALIVGRTIEDLEECKQFQLSTSPPAPTTINMPIETFEGTIICTHTLKPWAHFACGVELSERTIASAKKHPRRIIVGQTGRLDIYNDRIFQLEDVKNSRDFSAFKEEMLGTGQEIDRIILNQPFNNSGLFTLWWVLKEGYNPVYVCGLDFVSWDFINCSSPFDMNIAIETLRNHMDGKEPPKDMRLHIRTSRNIRMARQAYWTMRLFPETEVYRVGHLSNFPGKQRWPFDPSLNNYNIHDYI